MSDIFKKLFGADSKSIKPDCVILPSDDTSAFSDLSVGCSAPYHWDGGRKGCPVRSGNSGKLFSVINAETLTIIRTKFNLLAGDCVLYLKNSPCENIFLFGSCGGLGGKIGDRIIAGESLNMESFSNMLAGRGKFASVCPDKELTARLASFGRKAGVRRLKCATVNSLFLEEGCRDFFKKQEVKCLDMEASMVFSASRHTGRRAAGLFYVTDIVGEKNFYEKRSKAESDAISAAKKELARVLREFIENERAGN